MGSLTNFNILTDNESMLQPIVNAAISLAKKNQFEQDNIQCILEISTSPKRQDLITMIPMIELMTGEISPNQILLHGEDGFIIYGTRQKYMHIHIVLVNNSSRKKGIATKMLNHLSVVHPECAVIQLKALPISGIIKCFLSNGFRFSLAEKHFDRSVELHNVCKSIFDDYSNVTSKMFDPARCIDGSIKMVKSYF